MSRQTNHQSNIPTTIGSRFANPVCGDQLISSPCRNRPDTGCKCPLLRYDKDNDICNSCIWLGKGSHIPTQEQITAQISALKSKVHRGYWKNVKKLCKWPSERCTDYATRRGQLCTRHAQILEWRKKNWPERDWWKPVRVR